MCYAACWCFHSSHEYGPVTEIWSAKNIGPPLDKKLSFVENWSVSENKKIKKVREQIQVYITEISYYTVCKRT